jgi:hypothetical protein
MSGTYLSYRVQFVTKSCFAITAIVAALESDGKEEFGLPSFWMLVDQGPDWVTFESDELLAVDDIDRVKRNINAIDAAALALERKAE